MKSTPAAYSLFHSGSLALAEMEHHGLRIDVPYLDSAIEQTSRRIRRLEEKLKADPIYGTWRKEFADKTNLGSLTQLAHIIFGVMKHPCKFRTPTGRFKADERAFEEVNLPFVRRYRKMAKLKKAKSTYLDGIKREVVDGFIHPYYHLAGGSGWDDNESGGARSYRSSASDPNVHNIPNRDKAMAEIVRRCYIPRNGCQLVEVDFSALEFRIAACVYRDQAMVEYASDPAKDVHRDFAAKLFLCRPEDVSKEMRFVAKNSFVFPVIYGDYYVQCAKNIWESCHRLGAKFTGGTPTIEGLEDFGISELGACDHDSEPVKGTFEHHVREVEREFNETFPTFAAAKDSFIADYRRNGGFPLVTGFWISGLHKKNFVLNARVQGPAFHCLLWSLIELTKHIRRSRMKAKLVNEIHDSIVGDVPIMEMQAYLTAAKRIMTKDLPKAWKWIITPLEIEAEVSPPGKSWFAKVPYVERNGKWQPK